MSMPKPDPPCKPNCPNRELGCRSACSKWAAYQIVLVDDRKERIKKNELNAHNKQVKTRRYIPGNEGSRIK